MIREFRGKYRDLSNFSPHSVALDGVCYPTVEHAYQAAKTLDPFEREYIRMAPTPGKAKRRGRLVVLREDFFNLRVPIMHSLVLKKVLKHSDIRKLLISTAGEEIYEGNTWNDMFWGVSLPEMKGLNNLGKIYMEIRESLL